MTHGLTSFVSSTALILGSTASGFDYNINDQYSLYNSPMTQAVVIDYNAPIYQDIDKKENSNSLSLNKENDILSVCKSIDLFPNATKINPSFELQNHSKILLDSLLTLPLHNPTSYTVYYYNDEGMIEINLLLTHHIHLLVTNYIDESPNFIRFSMYHNGKGLISDEGDLISTVNKIKASLI